MMRTLMVMLTAFAMATETGVSAMVSDEVYLETRQHVLQQERSMRLGAQQNLNEKEEFLNQKLMAWKQREINQSLWEGTPFLSEMHFFHARPLMDDSSVFRFIRQMPKGGNLHAHFCATADLAWFVQNVTYRPHLYVCRGEDGLPLFRFFLSPPSNPDCPWVLLAEERNAYMSPQLYDRDLAANLSVVVPDPEKAYPSIRIIWQRFEPYFIGVLGAVNFLPVFTDYLWRTLEEFMEDGVQYSELRFTVELYDLEGSYSDEFMVQTVQDVVQRFKQQHPDFIDAKIVIASIKGKSLEQQIDAIIHTANLRDKYPHDVLGFDLIQHEDTAPSLLQLLPVLQHPATQIPPGGLPFFFHAGETAWTELTDENLIDAVLLNTTRIGHGYALLRHPWVLEQIRERGIAIELNPISNQVLKLVTDLRNHPGSVLLSRGDPVVVASDDPAVWGAKPLSHDFYVTFMALASVKDDLRTLKQLAINSLRYSALKAEKKAAALKKWEELYNRFVESMYLELKQEDVATQHRQEQDV